MIEPSAQLPTGAPPGPPPPPPEAPARAPRRSGAQALLEAVRRSQRRQLWLIGALAGSGAALVLLVLGGFAAHLSVALSRCLLGLAPLAGAGALAFTAFYRARRTVGDDARTARLVGQRIPEVSLDLLAAVELRRELGHDAPFSPELAEAFLRAEDARADLLAVRQIVDPALAHRAARGAAALALAAAVALALGWSSWSSGIGAALARDASGRAERAREPITGDFELTYRYPAYTGLAPRTVPGTGGEISAPRGTEVRLKTRADRDVERAEIALNGSPIPLQVKGGRELEGTFVVDRSGSYSIAFLSQRGRELARGPEIPVNVEVDTPPQVAIRTPGEQLEIDPGQTVTLRYDATDDFGVSELELVFRPQGRSSEVRVKLPHDEGRRTNGQYTWDLGGLKLSPGDHVSYHLEAKDNDTLSGPKVGVSRTQQIAIYSAAEHRRAAMKQVEQLWEKLVLLLADRLEGPDRAEPKDPKKVEAHQQVDQAALRLAGELQEGAEKISQQRDAPPELWRALSNIADRMRPRAQGTADARRMYLRYRRLDVPDLAPSRRLTRASEAEIAGLEKDIVYLESLLDRQKLEDLKELMRQLNSERRDLASLIEQFQKTQDPQVREDILAQIQQLRARMQELMERMAELARGIRDEHLNAEALQQLSEQKDMSAALSEIEKLMREGKSDEALKKLQQMAMQLDQMLQSLEGAQPDSPEYRELAKKFQQFMDDLEKTRTDQQRVAGETKAIRDRYKEQLRERVRDRAEALRKELLDEAKSLAEDYAEVQSSDMSPVSEQPLEKVQSELENLQSALKGKDFDLAAETADRAQRAAQDLAAFGEQQRRLDELYQRPPDLRRQSQKLSEQLARDARRTAEVNRKLQELFPPPGSMMSEQDRSRMQQLQGQQRQLEQRAQRLGEQLEEIAQQAPVFGPEASQQLGEAGRRMGEAANRLEGRDPGRGYGEQRAALDQLDRFKQELEKQQQGGGGSGAPFPFPMFAQRGMRDGNSSSNEKVEIPDAEAYQAPKEFRKDLLDAMKQGTPEKYRDQVKRYYEELVK